jgi:uncharacterized alkaline shock family protein YloU
MPERQAAPVDEELVLARAVAKAVTRLPGVLEMSAGRFAREGTYAPAEFVRGVVLKRPTPATLEVDVRVVLAQQTLTKAPAEAGQDGVIDGRTLSLPDLSRQIRKTVRRAIVQLGRQPPVAVNVFFDDVR